MKRLLFAISLSLSFYLPASAEYQEIPVVAAYAENSYDTTRIPTRTIDESGLSDGLHDADRAHMWMGNSPTWFLVDLGTAALLDRVKIWNFNMGGYATRGLTQVDFFVSVSNDVDPTTAPDFTDAAVWTLVKEDVVLPLAAGAAAYAGVEPFDLDQRVAARWFALRIDAIGSGGYGGLSEIKFYFLDGDAVHLNAIASSTTDSATFSGSLPGAPAMVYAAYGATDAGILSTDWEHFDSLGEKPSGDFSASLSSLAPDTGYFLRLAIPDGSGNYNFSAAATFQTGVISVETPAGILETDTQEKAVLLRRPASCATVPVTVAYTLSGGGAAAYAASFPGTATFAVGETMHRIPFTAVNDAESAADQTFTLTLQPGPYATDATSAGTVTILDSSSVAPGTLSWTAGAGTLRWETDGNWSLGRAPVVGDTLLIDAACTTNAPVVLSSDADIKKLTLGSAASTLGALSILGSATLSSGDVIAVGNAADSTGFLKVEGTLRTAGGKNLLVGNAGDGEFVVDGGSASVGISGQSGHTYVANASGSTGRVVVRNGGYFTVGYEARIGVNGTAEVLIDGGTMTSPSKYGLKLGYGASGEGTVVIRGGGTYSCGSSSYNHVGYNGKGTAIVENGSLVGRGVSIGDGAGSVGEIIVHPDGDVGTGTTGYHLYVGENGNGILRMRGGKAHYSKNGTLVVRASEGAFGLLEGWGAIDCYGPGGSIHNNGVVIADGHGSDATLSLTQTGAAFYNDIENTGTNGWYAVGKGCLYLKNAASVATGETGTYTWGESSDDEEIDLVNSARIRFANVTAALSSLEGSLYAPDHGNVPAIPASRNVLGIWKFTTNGAFDAFDLEVRYDRERAGAGVVELFRYDETESAWESVPTEMCTGFRAKATGLAPSGSAKVGFFMAAAMDRATVVILR